MTFELTSFDIIKGKVIRDGRVAIIVQDKTGGIGWSTQYENTQLMYDPYIVNIICNKKEGKLAKYVSEKYGPEIEAFEYLLSVIWLPVGTEFVIEYEPYEEVEIVILKDIHPWIKAGED